MGQRKSTEELKKKYNVSTVWSFSRANSFVTCSYYYFLKYIKKEKEKSSNIYSVLGGDFHDILEDFYLGKIEYSDMINKADSVIIDANMKELKFDKNDADRNESIGRKYFACMKHFFDHHQKVPHKVMCEQHIMIKVGKHYFQGYIDAIHKEGDTYIITDYKSSTIYTGKKILKEGKQLTLYALGLHQKGIPVENIRIRWNFLKYTSISFMQKNGKMKTTKAERHMWVEKLWSRLKSDLKGLGMDAEESKALIDEATANNNLDNMPQEVQDRYTLEDCYVDIPLDQEVLENVEKEFLNLLSEIYQRESLYDKTDDKTIWERKVEAQDTFFCATLCGYTPFQCPCYSRYLAEFNMFKQGEDVEDTPNDDTNDWLAELGLSEE